VSTLNVTIKFFFLKNKEPFKKEKLLIFDTYKPCCGARILTCFSFENVLFIIYPLFSFLFFKKKKKRKKR